ncbi:MAG TPA: SURF1 family protein [Arenimonas sp.]|nr:SURF1 family protein [Arenimonas sp.]
MPALLLALGFSLLGRWQLGRALEKEAQLAAWQSVLAQRQPQALGNALAMEVAWVSVRGRFRPGPALLLDNQRRGQAVGVRVYRVFDAADTSLLVELGWLPLPPDRRLPALQVPGDDEIPLTGLLLPPPSPGLALGPDRSEVDKDRWLLTRIDLHELSDALQRPLAPRVLRPDPAWPGGHARDLDIHANTLPPAKHRGYALQWFGLAATTVIIAFVLLLRARHDR